MKREFFFKENRKGGEKRKKEPEIYGHLEGNHQPNHVHLHRDHFLGNEEKRRGEEGEGGREGVRQGLRQGKGGKGGGRRNLIFCEKISAGCL